jgi:hypothetical protein
MRSGHFRGGSRIIASLGESTVASVGRSGVLRPIRRRYVPVRIRMCRSGILCISAEWKQAAGGDAER